MKAAKLYTPREAAPALGNSYSTLKRWIHNGKIRTVKTAGGHYRVPQREVDRFLYRAGQKGAIRERRRNFRRISSRKQLVGRVTTSKFTAS
jgi:excisionase family DNA binding protein